MAEANPDGGLRRLGIACSCNKGCASWALTFEPTPTKPRREPSSARTMPSRHAAQKKIGC
jgi:hypothetical protein